MGKIKIRCLGESGRIIAFAFLFQAIKNYRSVKDRKRQWIIVHFPSPGGRICLRVDIITRVKYVYVIGERHLY